MPETVKADPDPIAIAIPMPIDWGLATDD